MKWKRKVRFVDQALAVLQINAEAVDDADLSLIFLLTQFGAEQAVIKASIERVSIPAETIDGTLANRTEFFRAWITTTDQELTCFAIQISRDRGQSWTDPLQLLQ